MKMAKASQVDLDMAVELTHALEAMAGRWGACVPDKIERLADGEESERFDLTDHGQCMRVIEYLQQLVGSASLMRVVFGMLVLLDPRNKMVDPAADTLEHHPENDKGRADTALLDWLLQNMHIVSMRYGAPPLPTLTREAIAAAAAAHPTAAIEATRQQGEQIA